MNPTNQPIFSVVIPIYNIERYIKTCIDSVLAQTFTNFEIICVSDGSSDTSIALVEQYNDKRIRIIHQNNQGLSAARNTGINQSRGIYIALLDGDDFWLPNKLAAHFKHLYTNASIDISYSASQFVDEDSRAIGIGQHPKLHNITSAHIFCRNPVGNGSAAVMRKSFLNKIGKLTCHDNHYRFEYFDESLRQSEDIEFWLRATLDAAAKFEGIADPLTCYRVNASGLSANLDRQFQYWVQGVEKNRPQHREFFQRWYPLAKAYQQRYLARRAVQSGNSTKALQWLHLALASDYRILTQDAGRTIVTYCAALCSLLPNNIYQALQKNAIGMTRST